MIWRGARRISAVCLIAWVAMAGQVDDQRAIPRRPAAPRPLVAIFGSSTALGVGASSVETSWAGRLATALQGLGVQVRNVSISGTNTADSLARFDRDIRPLNPGYVVLATSIANESAINDLSRVRQVFTANTRLLIQRVEEIGAIPILITPYPQGIFNPSYREQMLEIARDFEAEGVTVWDFWNSADDGFGRWLPGLSADGTHPTDAGHLALFQGINLSFFAYAVQQNRPFPSLRNFGAWVAENGTTPPFLAVRPASELASWSAGFWVAARGDGRPVVLLDVGGSGAKLQRTGSRFEIIVGGQSVAAGDAGEAGAFQHLCLTYARQTGRIALYVDGIVIAQAAIPALPAASLFSLGSPGDPAGIAGETLAQLLIYRTPLCGDDVIELASGHIPVKSLEASLPLAQSPNRPVQNTAATKVDVAVEGSWHWVRTGPRVWVFNSPATREPASLPVAAPTAR